MQIKATARLTQEAHHPKKKATKYRSLFEVITRTLKVTHQAISHSLLWLVMMGKQGSRVSSELKLQVRFGKSSK